MFSENETINIEIKAKITDCENIRKTLLKNSAEFKGIDEQVDTYFKVDKGRLKLREGNIENCLVFYERENKQGPKKCKYSIIKFFPEDPVILKIKNILEISLGILVTVEKKREIYFI
jgi:adenylate cyclase, class 2